MGNVLDNQAAWIVACRTSPLRVSHAPYNTPGADEIVIRSSAVAINPVDWKQQDLDILIPSYPNNAVCLIKGKDYAVFQLYFKTPANIACILPGSMTPEEGCVMPLSVNTAADGLFSKGKLGLPLPSLTPELMNKAVFIYGGSTSVRSSAMQLAKAAGVYVVTTASKRNHEHCKALGADRVFDYNGSDWVDQVVNALAGRPVFGAFDTVAHGETTETCANLLSQLKSDAPITTINAPPNGTKDSTVFGANLTLDKPLAQAIWANYLEAALAQGKFSAQPKPQIVGHGLDKIQEGMDIQRKGVCAVKPVVKLD